MVFKCQFNELKLLTCIRMVKRLTKYKKKKNHINTYDKIHFVVGKLGER